MASGGATKSMLVHALTPHSNARVVSECMWREHLRGKQTKKKAMAKGRGFDGMVACRGCHSKQWKRKAEHVDTLAHTPDPNEDFTVDDGGFATWLHGMSAPAPKAVHNDHPLHSKRRANLPEVKNKRQCRARGRNKQRPVRMESDPTSPRDAIT